MSILKFIIPILLVVGVVYGGYKYLGSKASTAPVIQEMPVVTLTGKISVAGVAVSISTNDGKLVELSSRKVDLTQYHGKTVTVSGQYSGTTLYVDSIK